MTNHQTIQDIVDDPEHRIEDLRVTHLEELLGALVHAERPESIRVFIWHMLRLARRDPDFEVELLRAWKTTEERIAQLLEDAGGDGAPIVFKLIADEPSSRKQAARLFKLAEDLNDTVDFRSQSPRDRLSRLPMVAFWAERQLDQLISAVAKGIQWKDPADVLDPERILDMDLEFIIALAQARMIRTDGSGEALNLVMLRLLNWTGEETS